MFNLIENISFYIHITYIIFINIPIYYDLQTCYRKKILLKISTEVPTTGYNTLLTNKLLTKFGVKI